MSEIDPAIPILLALIEITFGCVLIITFAVQFKKLSRSLQIAKVLVIFMLAIYSKHLVSKLDSYRYVYRLYIYNESGSVVGDCEASYNGKAVAKERILPKYTKQILIPFTQDGYNSIVLKSKLGQIIVYDTILIPSSTESGFRANMTINDLRE